MSTKKAIQKTAAKKTAVPESVPVIDIHEHKAPAVSGIHLIVYQNCPGDKEFVLANGSRLRNLFELSEELAQMNEDVFNHHVTKEKNDFASWVEHVFSEKKLAEHFRQSSSKERHEIHLLKHLLGKIMSHEKKH